MSRAMIEPARQRMPPSCGTDGMGASAALKQKGRKPAGITVFLRVCGPFYARCGPAVTADGRKIKNNFKKFFEKRGFLPFLLYTVIEESQNRERCGPWRFHSNSWTSWQAGLRLRLPDQEGRQLLRPVPLPQREDRLLLRLAGQADVLLLRVQARRRRGQLHHGD